MQPGVQLTPEIARSSGDRTAPVLFFDGMNDLASTIQRGPEILAEAEVA
jgi:hypothetical protein